MQRLPEAEDSLVFYDGKLHFSQMRKLVDFIRQAGQNDPKAGRIADILESVFDEVSIIDCQVTVEYTEGNLNRSASFGRLLPGSEGKLLFKAFAAGQPFENWQTWVPAESLSYSLQTGVNLHTLYEGVVQLIRDRIPKAQSGLEKFEQLQSAWDVHIDRDILQAFSGEFVSVSLPAATPQTFGGADSVLALRCQKPERNSGTAPTAVRLAPRIARGQNAATADHFVSGTRGIRSDLSEHAGNAGSETRDRFSRRLDADRFECRRSPKGAGHPSRPGKNHRRDRRVQEVPARD